MEFLQDSVIDYLKNNRIKKKDFAELIGVSPVTLSRWLTGKHSFNPATIDKIKETIRN